MLKENIERILTEISDGNNRGEKITLVAATKTQSAETINQAVDCGIKVVAENRVQEFREKTDLIKNCEQHFIGHLQTNKVKYLIGKVSLIHSVDSLHLAEEISKESIKKTVTTDVLIEVNVGGELSKSGVTVDNAERAVLEISTLPNIRIVGLMAMLPKTDDKAVQQSLCIKMRDLYDNIKAKTGLPFSYLSMGMSADYKMAIANGSNMIRLGSTIFGARA